MKRLFVFLACLISLAIFSCSDSKDDNGDDPNGGNSSNVTLELSTTDIVFEAGGGEKEFYITCNGDWTIANASQWCKTDITSGNGNATISVTVNPSELYDDQNTNITVKAGTNTKILTVTQKKKDALLLTKDKYDNLFMSNTSNLKVEGKAVSLEQATHYPWNGDVTIGVNKNNAGQFTMKIRIPGWVRNQVVPSDLYTYSDGKRLSYTVKVNGEPVQSELKDGYFCIDRRWKKGDKVAVHFDMEPRTVKANNKVEADRGRIAVERGPIVYCAEWPDNDFDVLSVFMNRTPQFEVVEKPDLLYGINQLKTDAQILGYDDRGRLTATDVKLTLIPYYAWAHRGAGAMAVWLPQELSASRPTMPATLASESKVDASHKVKSISAINDRLVPKDENDRSVPYYHWWPKQGTTEWISYEFPSEATVSSATVYWYDDAPWGGCRIPQSWKMYYKDAQGQWQPVSGADKYGVEKGTGNTVNFDPVKTKAVKLEIVQPADNSSGLFEWEVK